MGAMRTQEGPLGSSSPLVVVVLAPMCRGGQCSDILPRLFAALRVQTQS
eukprot:CAMPEP_0178985140 /NCGR_PEP_ID=MMETSP0795-20121207/1990_1 /TAXON_ID=88552 /ORGANISM="Amoebophrya sp., Strain Ameob2" /LENGTH=48 /DNA_ID= /DNA_START= /DNA_END= /DNA_ORIENTATION=